MARVFSAVDIEDDNLLRKLKEVRDSMDLSFSPMPREKMHITFQFFEDVDQEEVSELKKALEKVTVESFTAKVQGVGVFPSRDYIRVVWAGVEDGKFTRLHKQVSSHTVETGNSYEFRPHVTLLRVDDISRDEKRKLQRMLREFEDHRFGEFEVDRVKLFESRLKSSGSEYRTVHEKKL